MREVTNRSFQAEVLEAAGPVVVDFWAPWCGPCVAVEPILAGLERDHEEVSFTKLNVDENAETAARYAVFSIPTTILFEDGEPRDTVIGARPRKYFEEAWATWLAPSAEPSTP